MIDTTAPVISCPADITIECDESTDPDVNASLGTATASDVCDPNVVVSYTDNNIPINGCEFVTERTWTAQDECGNTSSCVQTIKHVDTTPPEIYCPYDYTLECDEEADPATGGKHPGSR